MARPRSEDKRSAILAAAARIIVTQGLGASTAAIAKEAGVANGSLFTYFETKTELLNRLYVELKSEMAAAAMAGLDPETGLREQMLLLWTNWMRWAVESPEKRRALAQLGVSDEVTRESREAGHAVMRGIGELVARCREQGPMRGAPMGFVVTVMNALAEATMDFMVQDPAHAEEHCRTGFEAAWRAIA
jgi:AcrR family transcriptional regulator